LATALTNEWTVGADSNVAESNPAKSRALELTASSQTHQFTRTRCIDSLFMNSLSSDLQATYKDRKRTLTLKTPRSYHAAAATTRQHGRRRYKGICLLLLLKSLFPQNHPHRQHTQTSRLPTLNRTTNHAETHHRTPTNRARNTSQNKQQNPKHKQNTRFHEAKKFSALILAPLFPNETTPENNKKHEITIKNNQIDTTID